MSGDYKVYLGNLAEDIRDRDVEKFLKGYGRIRNIVVKTTSTGVSLLAS